VRVGNEWGGEGEGLGRVGSLAFVECVVCWAGSKRRAGRQDCR